MYTINKNRFLVRNLKEISSYKRQAHIKYWMKQCTEYNNTFQQCILKQTNRVKGAGGKTCSTSFFKDPFYYVETIN